MKASLAIAHSIRMKNKNSSGGAPSCRDCLSTGGLCLAHGGEIEEPGDDGYDQDFLSNEDSDPAEAEEGSDLDMEKEDKIKSRLSKILMKKR